VNDSSRCRNGGSAKKDDLKVGHWRSGREVIKSVLNAYPESACCFVGLPSPDSSYKNKIAGLGI